MSQLVVERLSASHAEHIAAFGSSSDSLTRFLQQEALEYDKRGFCSSFLVFETTDASRALVGYYSLNAFSIQAEALPRAEMWGYPGSVRRNGVPAVLISRLAVAQAREGQGFGKLLLLYALRHVVFATQELAARLVVVHALDERALAFYRYFGFQSIAGEPRHLFLAIKRIRELMEA